MKKEYLEAGKIVNTHGIRGEVKIMPYCDSPELLCDFDRLFMGKSLKEIYIEVKNSFIRFPSKLNIVPNSKFESNKHKSKK